MGLVAGVEGLGGHVDEGFCWADFDEPLCGKVAEDGILCFDPGLGENMNRVWGQTGEFTIVRGNRTGVCDVISSQSLSDMPTGPSGKRLTQEVQSGESG